MGRSDIFSQQLKELLWQINEAGGAPCRTRSELFFFEPYREVPSNEAVEAAKNLCRVCPVRIQCLDVALIEHETYGIWGGLTPDERSKLRR